MLTFTYIKTKIINVDFMITETERLFIRELTKDDFSALYSVLADSDITQHYPYTFDKARVMNWIDKSIERYNIFGFGLWAVCLKDNIPSPLSLCHTVVKNLMNLLTVKMKQLLCTESQGQSGRKLKYNFIQKFT